MGIPVTKEGHEMLKRELAHLKKHVRPQVIQDIVEARAHGDLKENAEYSAAKEKQGFVEGRIQELLGKIANAQVINPTSLSGEKVVFGATVTLYNIDDDTEIAYYIVGEDEAEIKEGKISVYSPIARAIIGRSVGDEVKVITPKKTINCEILAVSFV